MKFKYLISILLTMLVFSFSFSACTAEEVKNDTGSAVETQSIQKNIAETNDATADTEKNNTATETSMDDSGDYLTDMKAFILEGTNAVRKFSQSGTDYSSGNINIDQYKEELGTFIKDIDTLNDNYTSMVAPEEYATSHESVGKAIEHLTTATSYLQQYIDSNDNEEMSDLYTKAASELSAAGMLFIEAASSL